MSNGHTPAGFGPEASGEAHMPGSEAMMPPMHDIDPLPSKTDTLIDGKDETRITQSVLRADRSVFLPISEMPPVIEIVPVPTGSGETKKALTHRNGVSTRLTLLEQSEDGAFDTSTATMEDVSQAMGEKRIVPRLELFLADGLSIPSAIAAEGYANNPRFQGVAFSPDVAKRTIHVGSREHFPLTKPVPKPGEGLALIGPDKASDKDLDINAVLYDKEGNFSVRPLSPEVIDLLQREEAYLGMWIGTDSEGNAGIFGRDTYLPEASENGPLVVIETRDKPHLLDGTPMRSPALQEELGRLGVVASTVETTDDYIPRTGPERPTSSVPEEDDPDLVTASVAPVSPELTSIMQQMRERGYADVPEGTGRRFLRRGRDVAPPTPFRANK